MLIRKNTKTFKTIVEIVTACQSRPDREKLIRLYITRAGNSVKDRIDIEGIQGETGLFYEMNFQAVLGNLNSSNHQLHVSDEVPGIYFFRTASNKVWDEMPFEFDEAIKDEFSTLPDLPLVRKKEKATKYVIPAPKLKTEPPQEKKKKVEIAKVTKAPAKGPKQPDFKLRHDILFTDLQKIVFRQAQLNKQGVLDYYNKISEYILPYLKDRPLWTRRDADSLKPSEAVNVSRLFADIDENVPAWIKRETFSEDQQDMFLCNDKDHLLFFVEKGCLEFDHGLSNARNAASPDHVIIIIDPPDSDITKAIDVALTTKGVLEGLKLPSFIMTDGISGFQIYIPLEPKGEFETSRRVSECICKLIRLKIPDLTGLKESDKHFSGKVALDYSRNELGKSVVAPYSLVPGQLAIVATPIEWAELQENLRLENFTHETIFARLKKSGDPFSNLYRKKVNADALLEKLETNYSFLF